MLKQVFMLLGVLSVRVYASTGVEDSNVNKREATEGVKLDDYPYGVAEEIKNAKEGPVEGQRQKRFYDYIDYSAAGASSFSSNYPSVPIFAWSDNPPGTDIPDEQYRLNEILKRVKNLADITKRQYLPPINRPKVHYPSFIPYFVPQFRCTCPQVHKPVNRPRPAPQTTISPPNTDSSPGTINTGKPGTTTVPDSFGNRDFNVSSPGLIPNDDFADDYEDGVRPISFDPITPKVPLGVKPPPVEHGSFQAGLNSNPTEFNSPVTAAAALQTFSTAKLPTGEMIIPTICDGAILACCHKKEVTNACFVREGCGDIEHDDPCDPSVLSKVISKFRAYINQRHG